MMRVLGGSELKFIHTNPTHPFDRTTNRSGAERPERIYRDDEPQIRPLGLNRTSNLLGANRQKAYHPSLRSR